METQCCYPYHTIFIDKNNSEHRFLISTVSYGCSVCLYTIATFIQKHIILIKCKRNRRSEYKPQLLICPNQKKNLKAMPTNCSSFFFSLECMELYVDAYFFPVFQTESERKRENLHKVFILEPLLLGFFSFFIRGCVLLLLRWARLFNELLLTSNWIRIHMKRMKKKTLQACVLVRIQ